MMEDERVVLVAKPRATAPMWAHFGFKSNDKGLPNNLDEPICKLCRKKIPVKGGNTTNLKQHLQVHHPQNYAELGNTTPAKAPVGPTAARQQTIGESIARSSKYPRDSVKWLTLTDSITRFIAKEMLPFNTVEKASFKEMLFKHELLER